jgi:hypothetical protein
MDGGRTYKGAPDRGPGLAVGDLTVSDDTVVDSATAKAAAQRCDPFGGDDRTSRGGIHGT